MPDMMMSQAEPSRDEAEALITLYQAGRYAEVEAAARQMTQCFPGYGFGWKMLGRTGMAQGRYLDALEYLQKTVALLPDDANAYNSLGITCIHLGRLREAEASLRRAVAVKPEYINASINLGTVLHDLGQLEEAVSCYRTVLKVRPDLPEGYNNLAMALKELGRLEEAEQCLRRALELKPGYAEAYNNLGMTLKESGRLEEAVACYRRALELKPDYAEIYTNLGVVLTELGCLEEAKICCCRAVELRPGLPETYNNLGMVLKELEHLVDAEACFRRALEIKPDYAGAHSNMGVVLNELDQPEQAGVHYSQALELEPEYAEAYNNRGIMLKDLGRLVEAEESFLRALEYRPDYFKAQSNLLFTLNYSADRYLPQHLEQARTYGKMVAGKTFQPFTAWSCSKTPARLRVGLVSGDLRNHPVGYFLESVLTRLDLSRLELFAYPADQKADDLTARIKPCFSAWKPLTGSSDELAARLIHRDGIHVLLDLSGHTAKNRLPVFAWKPAPVQASWLGYFATTGISGMDYLLGDPFVTPEGEEGQYTETIWRLPDSYLCFTPPSFPLEVGPLPALSHGCITFGSFNNLTKMNDSVVALWAKVLAAVSGSRLFLKAKQLNDPGLCETTRQRFAAHNIPPERLLLEGGSPRPELLAAYNRVDIALDPFPYPGGTTSVEGLWMGVPALTRRGDRFLSHVGESIAHNAGLPDWIAGGNEDYITKAVQYASSLDYLANLRSRLRQNIMVSPLFDASRFARNLEDTVWGMWEKQNNF